MKLRKVLCMAALSAAVALTGIPQGAAALVYAGETQTAGLDAIIQQMYASFQSGDHDAMYALDTDVVTETYVEQVKASGSDRYVIDLDSSRKAMLYVDPNGGWKWYFGAMENNLRQGQGTTVSLSSNAYEIFSGVYIADMPNGTGTYAVVFPESGGYTISGTFQGAFLNGAYQVDTHWFNEYVYSDSLTITYANNHFQSISNSDHNWVLSNVGQHEDGSLEYQFYSSSYDDGWTFSFENGSELFAVGFSDLEDYWWASKSTEILNNGLPILWGNPAASAAPTTLAPTPETPAPAPETPAPTPEAVPSASTGTYIVERGDTLCQIAQKVYGDRKYWRTIYEANKDTIRSGYIIRINQVLTIPAL